MTDIPSMRKLIDQVQLSEGDHGYIAIHKSTTRHSADDSENVDCWGAAFFKKRPTGKGVEHADKVLVQTDSRAAKSREATVAAAKKLKPDAEVIDF